MFGTDDEVNAHIAVSVAKTAELRSAIVEVSHPATELVLTRQCADVSKLSYQLRTNGDRIDSVLLERFDADLRCAAETIIGGDVPDSSWWQATIGVRQPGLGLRQAALTALPAFVASRISSWPQVATMAGHLETAGIAHEAAVMEHYDARTEDALVQLVASLPHQAPTQTRQCAGGASARDATTARTIAASRLPHGCVAARISRSLQPATRLWL